MPRTFPALHITSAGPVDDESLGLVLAELDAVPPIVVEPLADGARLFFGSSSDRAEAVAALQASALELSIETIDVPDDDWAARSQASLGPVRVGRIVVSPPWSPPPAGCSPQPILITIQPSMGFGTAHHASTRLCLRLLQEMATEGTRVIDLGTGSGVLAIAAATLGAAHVVAIDNDLDALESARENVELNGVSEIVQLTHGDVGAGVSQPAPGLAAADLVLANLTGALLTRLARDIGRLAVPGGKIIVSGVLNDEADGVSAAFREVGLQLAQRLDEDEWVGLLLATDSTR